MVDIGAKVIFVPGYLDSKVFTPEERKAASVKGTVVGIHSKHKYFTVAWDCGGTRQLEAFKLCDIGKAVKVCG
jgi:hypothetical protein